MSLETVDLPGVEILAATGPIHGVGSPPEGDTYSSDDLRTIAAANRDLRGELNPPAKIGHSNAGNAVGWLDNIRTTADGRRLVADIRRVPKRFAELVKAGAYRTRSVELSRVTSQRSGKRYPLVISAMAWLGDRVPAVKDLADVFSLYEGEAEVVRAYELATPATESGELLADEAIDLGTLNERQREPFLRLYASDPETTRDLLRSMGFDGVRAWVAEMDGDLARLPSSDPADRAYVEDAAVRLGIRPEDVV